MGSTTIKPFPELVDLAQREADDLHARMEMRLSGGGVDALRAAVLAQLCDLTRPASRDAVARLVAAKIGIDLAGIHQRLGLPGFPMLRLYDYCGVPDTAQGNGEHAPAEALALIVRHLWPEESP